LVYLMAGAAVYSHIEGWAYLDAVYWADFTLLTVGIGDYSLQTHLGRGLLFPFAIGGISKCLDLEYISFFLHKLDYRSQLREEY